MDNRQNLHDALFSRNSTPPTQPPPEQHPFSPHIGQNSSPSLIDALFQTLPPAAPSASSDQLPIHNKAIDVHQMEKYDTPPVAQNAPLPGDPVISAQPGSNSATDRQNVLLSLLNQPSAGRPQAAQPQQVPTPPGSISLPSSSPQQSTDSQKLLDQIMGGGSTSRSTTYSDTQRSSAQGSSPPYSQRDDYQSFPLDHPVDASPRTRPIQQIPVPPPHQAQPPSPRRSIFEYNSPFDHLANAKKKVIAQAAPASHPAEDAWSAAVNEPKRQSAENLLVNLNQPQPVPAQPPAYEPYDFQQSEPVLTTTRAPLPPIPANQKPMGLPILPAVSGSPRGSSPKPLHRSQAMNNNQQMSYSGPSSRRDKENSPARAKPAPPKVQQPLAKFTRPQSPGPQSQLIVFDVSQPLDEVQARDSVKSTAIALVRQDPVFLPGTTIGATHWVAYAMTRGRVRVISRSSGDRTLLQLPQVFASTSSVIDMAVYGNRLAGVTSDGGFVVWELPEVIMDDVPGRILLCVPPTNDHDAIRAVKWHPKDPDTLAIASDNKIFLIDLANTHALHVQPLPHSDLHHIGQVYNVPSVIVAFDFDVANDSLATISEDSTLTVWRTRDNLPDASHKIYGEDIASSLTFVDGGIVVGRKNGTIFQLLSVSSKNVLSTVKFVSSAQEDADMFGHINYDSRIQTLWVANSRRESLIALKLHIEPPYIAGEDGRSFIEQVTEFSGIKPTIHFVILTADSDPVGDEAHAACVAAKIHPGELALVAFSVHSSGVDQVLIRKEWYDDGLAHAGSKFPLDLLPMQPTLPPNVGPPMGEPKPQRNPLPVPPTAAPQPQQAFPPSFVTSVGAQAARGRTPPSEDVENDLSSDQRGSRSGSGSKGKNVNWKEREERDKERGKPSDLTIISDSALGQALSREIRKTEDSLHSKIGKLIGKEMDKQHQRFEETRMHEQAEEFARQEKILKLISSELTRNTTRVVEQAVKTEVQQSVLPSLESVTRAEVKAVLNDQLGSGMVEIVNRGLPGEIEKILLRPNVSSHYANLLTQALMPVIERQIKETLGSAFIQFHAQHSANLQQEVMRELRKEIVAIKSDLGSWHSEALRGQEATIRDLERTVRSLSEQVKFLSLNASSSALHPLQTQPAQNSTGGAAAAQLQPNLRVNVPAANAQPAYNQPLQNFQQAPPQPTIRQQWYPSLAAPQASVPTAIPQPSSAGQDEKTPPPQPKAEEWDTIYLDVLTSQDPARLRTLLARTNPEVVVSLNGPLVSQAVILTLVHRLSGTISEMSPDDELFKTMLWWLQRVVQLVRPDDKLIADFIPRVVPTVQQSLNATKQRLTILPGGSVTIEAVRQLTEVQDVLRRKIPG